MFTVYHSNQLSALKTTLCEMLRQQPNPDPFAPETVLVQSLGMAQWLQMQIADELGVAASLQFPYPTSFLWQQYRALFPALPKENLFARDNIVWRLMRLMPSALQQPELQRALQPLNAYLDGNDQLKLYQLAQKTADLFDQYLVYRPHWLISWEKGELQAVENELKLANEANLPDIRATIRWQSALWNLLLADIRAESSDALLTASHRAYLQQRYFEKLDNLTEEEKQRLPERIFIFGISAMPPSQLAVLRKLGEQCDIHLFFANPCAEYWGNSQEAGVLEKLVLRQQISPAEFAEMYAQQGNPLLAGWGKQGREFLNLLTEQNINERDLYVDYAPITSLLAQTKQAILTDCPQVAFEHTPNDRSIQIHACHSMMREVEVLHNQLLHLFEQHGELAPKDIIVMSPDIDSYAPYIHAVFARYEPSDPRYIPFALSDQKISTINPMVSAFLRLLQLNDSRFALEDVLDLLDVAAIRTQFMLTEENLHTLRSWLTQAGVRAGLSIEQTDWQNFTAWENGLNRLLLGSSLKEADSAWQETLAFDPAYGLAAEQVGNFAKFLENLTAWGAFLRESHSINDWQTELNRLIDAFYHDSPESADTLLTLKQAVDTVAERIQQGGFDDLLQADILSELLEQQLSEQRSSLQFLVGRVNFCTLLPMRAIPFDVVCLLGMNEGDFPRQQPHNSFDLMHYAPQKGDRAKRDDDRYLFLEALLSAQRIFYLSYLGRSPIHNQAKLPSVLITQLQQFLGVEGLETAHPLSPFSPQNLQGGRVSYDKEWLELPNCPQQAVDFLQKLATPDNLPEEIAIEQLTAYLQHPLKWFCQQRLGLYLDAPKEPLEEAEYFELDPLSDYLLLDELLQQDTPDFFHKQQLKGKLPANRFGELTEQALRARVAEFQQTLATYLARPADTALFDLRLETRYGNVRLTAALPHRFGDELVLWRVGKLRDKDRIQLWLYQLLLAASHSPMSLRFYHQGKNGVECFSPELLKQTRAEALLAGYVEDYLASFSELKWAINEQLESYLVKAQQAETSGAELCQTALEQNQDPYIQRLLSQSRQLDYSELHQRTLDWFEPMLESHR